MKKNKIRHNNLHESNRPEERKINKNNSILHYQYFYLYDYLIIKKLSNFALKKVL